MEKVWVLSVKTHLDGGEFINDGWKTTCRVFASFDSAKKAMRDEIKKYATEENAMFDGNGRIVYFKEFADQYGYEHGFEPVQQFLQSFFTDENFPNSSLDVLQISEEDEDYNDCYISCRCDEAELLIHEGEEATMTELEPYIHTNALLMDEPQKDYFIYLSDLFSSEQIGCPSRIYIDLKCVDVE